MTYMTKIAKCYAKKINVHNLFTFNSEKVYVQNTIFGTWALDVIKILSYTEKAEKLRKNLLLM